MSLNSECLICHKPANAIPPAGDYEERACPECGHYKISRTALTSMEAQGFTFNIGLMREWLAAQQGSGEIPVINWQVAACRIRV
jgi:hypothetical protein